MKSIRGTIPAHITQHVARLRVIEDSLRDCLPQECCSHCRVAGLTEQSLILVTDSPAWRTRLHFYSDRIIRHFNDLGKFPIQRVNVRVVHRIEANRVPLPRIDAPLKLPAEAAQGFASLARATEDDALRHALERLAAHAPASGKP